MMGWEGLFAFYKTQIYYRWSFQVWKNLRPASIFSGCKMKSDCIEVSRKQGISFCTPVPEQRWIDGWNFFCCCFVLYKLDMLIAYQSKASLNHHIWFQSSKMASAYKLRSVLHMRNSLTMSEATVTGIHLLNAVYAIYLQTASVF